MKRRAIKITYEHCAMRTLPPVDDLNRLSEGTDERCAMRTLPLAPSLWEGGPEGARDGRFI